MQPSFFFNEWIQQVVGAKNMRELLSILQDER